MFAFESSGRCEMSVDWTTVLITIGPASVTGFVGYYSARKNAEVSVKAAEKNAEASVTAAEKNAEVLLEQARSGIKQIGLEQAISDRRERESAYTSLLDSLRELEAMHGVVSNNPAEVLEWKHEFDHRVNAAVLLGPFDIPKAAEQCAALVHKIVDAPGGFSSVRVTLDQYRTRLLVEMRKDVAGRKDDINAFAGEARPDGS
jgi:hypothetical protein